MTTQTNFNPVENFFKNLFNGFMVVFLAIACYKMYQLGWYDPLLK